MPQEPPTILHARDDDGPATLTVPTFRPHDLSAPIPCYVPRRARQWAEAAANASALLSRIGLRNIARRVYAWGWRQEGWIEPLSLLAFPSKPLALWSRLERAPAFAQVETWGALP